MLGFPTARTLRIEIPTAKTAMPSSRTVRPMTCDPNSELLSEIGPTDDMATALWP